MKLYQRLQKEIVSKLFPHGKVYIIIGDEGVILTQLCEGQLVSRYFFRDLTEQTKSEIKDLLQSNSAPIYLLIDNAEQEYKIQHFPDVNSFIIHSLVEKRLEHEFAYSTLKGAYFLYRDNIGKNDWVYLFAHCPFSGTFKEWYKALVSITFRIEAIMFLPIEAANLSHRLVDHFFTTPKQKASRFQMLVTQNKVSGFRQMVFDQGKLIFTRLVKEEEGQFKDVVAGNIQHEIYSTIEYLKRNGAENAQELDVFIVVEQELKKYLYHHHLKVGSVTILTPHEAAVISKVPKAIQESDRFADILTVATLNRGKTQLGLLTKEIIKKVILRRASVSAKVASYLVGGLMLFDIINQGSDYYRHMDNKAVIEESNRTLSAQITQIRQNSGIDLSQTSRIKEVVNVYEYVNGVVISPIPFLTQFSRIMMEEMVVKNFDWQVEPSETSSSIGVMQQPSRSFTLTFDLEIFNNDTSYGRLFEKFESFEKEVREAFGQYEVTSYKIRQNTDIEAVEKFIPIQITIKGSNGKA